VKRRKSAKNVPTSQRGDSPGRNPAAATARPKFDLSKIRHDLRTPINHILGYCEMLQEDDEQVPADFLADLQKIHTGGRQLLVLINEYFDDETFQSRHRDLHQLCHELRTPVNHVIGYSELLQEQAEAAGLAKHLPDLQKIHAAANTWLALMEEYLIPAGAKTTEPGVTAPVMSLPLVNAGIRFQAPLPGAGPAMQDQGALLVVDDDEVNRELLVRRLRRHGYTVSVAANGLEALKLVRTQPFDLVLLDMMMPGIDGYQVLARMKADSALQNIPVIMLSALDQEIGIARCIEVGAEDYIAKPFNPVFLRARIGACMEKKRLRDQERRTYLALAESQRKLVSELAQAAEYVRSLLPQPMTGAIRADWRFFPCEQLGGDVLSYEWLDETHLACYVVDVCGHGMSAAFHSISVLNVMRSQALPGTNFKDPAAVLANLNARFPMETHHNMYFTVWYGVYETSTRQLTYASAGHPPAILIGPPGAVPTIHRLHTPGVLIGYMPESVYASGSCAVPPGSRLFIFSDGAYEIEQPNGLTLQLDDLINHLSAAPDGSRGLDSLIDWTYGMAGKAILGDDLSIVEMTF
jgi:phosphoserine phosphatase RsbU/P